MSSIEMQAQTDKYPVVMARRGVSRLGLSILILMCGVVVFIFASNYYKIFSTNQNVLFEGGVVGAFLAAALLFRRSERLRPYWQLAYAFFVAAFVYLITSLLAGFSDTTLRTLGLSTDSSAGFAVAKVASVLVAVIPMLLLTRLSGARLDTVYLQRGALRLGLTLGSGALVFFASSAFMFTAGRFTAPDRLLAAAGWGLVFALANGFMEELWFRGLFLKRLEPLVGPLGAILIISIWFSLVHAGSVYLTPFAIPFMLANTFLLGLACAYAARKTDSLLAPTLIHAATDLFLFMAMFASV